MPEDRCDVLCLDLEVAERLRRSLLSEQAAATAASRASALSDPTRLRLAVALGDSEELCVCDLAWISGRSEKLVSHHVRVLRDVGLAESRRDGRIVFYRLTPRGGELLGAVLQPATKNAAR